MNPKKFYLFLSNPFNEIVIGANHKWYKPLLENYQTDNDSLCGLYKIQASNISSAKHKLWLMLEHKICSFNPYGVTIFSFQLLRQMIASYDVAEVITKLKLFLNDSIPLQYVWHDLVWLETHNETTDISYSSCFKQFESFNDDVQLNIIKEFYFNHFVSHTILIETPNTSFITSSKENCALSPYNSTLFFTYLEVNSDISDFPTRFFPFAELPQQHII